MDHNHQSPRAAATEAWDRTACAPREKPLQEARVPQPASGPLLSTSRESPHPQPETQRSQK